MSDSLGDVEYVLSKFFEKDGELWRNKRCDRELKAYQGKRKSASLAGKASAEARRSKAQEQGSNDRSTTVQPTINQEPLTINKEQEDQNTISGKPDYGDQIDIVIAHLNKRADRQYRRGQANDRLIKARLKEGHTVADLCSVVDHF